MSIAHERGILQRGFTFEKLAISSQHSLVALHWPKWYDV